MTDRQDTSHPYTRKPSGIEFDPTFAIHSFMLTSRDMLQLLPFSSGKTGLNRRPGPYTPDVYGVAEEAFE
jgi:hypothetical protein